MGKAANVSPGADIHPGVTTITMSDPFPSAPDADGGQFVNLLIEIQPQLRSFIGHLMPMVDSRADLLQEVNMVVWKKRDQFTMGDDPAKAFRNWAYT
ncbi:MAG: hypothetical protein EOP85_09445, partial [Verrucomicrobiaceae bacterium]